MISFLLAAFLAIPAAAQDARFQSACFHGLDDTNAPAVLDQCDGQDMLDVESNLSGSSIIKRKGYAKSADMTITTAPITGSHFYTDTSGNQIQIVCQDRNCARSVNGGAFTVIHTTASAGVTRWSIVSAGGIAYMANDMRDLVIKVNGASTSTPVGIPQGSILELTQQRLIVGDVAGVPNRVYYSSAGAFENFTTGSNSQDPYYDDLGSPGDKITGLKYHGNFLYVFKTKSITVCELSDQYSSICTILSPTIGTSDPGSIVSAGDALYFKAQDKTYWAIEGGRLRLLSRKIANLVKSQNQGAQRSNTQTTTADWTAGVQSPTGTWNTATLSGSIFPSSVTFVDTSSTQFNAGTLPASLTTTTNPGYIQFSSAAYQIYNGTFETGDLTYWTCSTAGGTCQVSAAGKIDGTYGAQVYSNTSGSNVQATVSILNPTNTVLYSVTYTQDPTILTQGRSIDLYALGLSTQTLKIKFDTNSDGNVASLTSTTFTAISSITWSARSVSGGFGWGQLDTIQVNRYFSLYQASATPAFYMSQVYDVGLTTAVGGPFVVGLTTETGGGTNIVFETRSGAAASAMPYAWTSISSGSRITEYKRYEQYGSTFTTSVGTATPILDYASLAFATTGFYRTQCIQPNSAITSWGILSCAQTLGGIGGNIVYYASATTTCGGLPTTDPLDTTKWNGTPVSNNATLSIATNTAVEIAWRSLLGSATDQAQVDACTLYWNEGVSAQPTVGTYDPIKNAVYWNTTVNNAAYSNRLLKYDRNLDSWYPFSITATNPTMVGTSLYFGGASSGTWNLYGGNDSDNGAAIGAYWKSKDIGGESPFVEKDFSRLSVLSRNQGSGTLSATVTLSNGKTSSYSISLSTTTGLVYARSNYNLPLASPQNFANVKLSNANANEPFEVLGFQMDYTLKPWRVSGP